MTVISPSSIHINVGAFIYEKLNDVNGNKDQANANFFWEVSNLPCHSVTVKKLLTYEEHLCSSMF